MLSPEIQSKVNAWLTGAYDDETKQEIQKLIDNQSFTELTDAFYKDLEFGTGGLRGIMGVGSNRINHYTIGTATQGFANYLRKVYGEEWIHVAIAYDSRNNSEDFAQLTAEILCANGIIVYMTPNLHPTPFLSFLVRDFECQGGIVITASHNPKEYNGYKVYWNDGSQVVAPHDKNIIEEVRKVKVEDILFKGKTDNIFRTTELVDEKYLDAVKGLSLNPKMLKRQRKLKIVYTPIHGSGITLVPQALENLGFENVTIVAEQAQPNGDFPTVIYPNPEEAEAMKLGLIEAERIDADLLLGTDPDADRVGIAVKNHKNEWQLLNGNQTAVLMTHYLLSGWQKNGKLKGREYIAKTIVTTYLLNDIAKAFGVKCYDTLTGFKYIAELLRKYEGKQTYIGGGEESYGYLAGDFVRDKDAVSACSIIAEMTAQAKDEGKTLFEQLLEIYVKYGFYWEHLVSITKKGKSGADEIKAMMDNYRQNPPLTLGGSTVVRMCDYERLTEENFIKGTTTAIDFEQSNVLQFFTADGSVISARPSGTEPKIKFYFSVKSELQKTSDFDAIMPSVKAKIDQIVRELGL
jgi:phosphoglucomutase